MLIFLIGLGHLSWLNYLLFLPFLFPRLYIFPILWIFVFMWTVDTLMSKILPGILPVRIVISPLFTLPFKILGSVFLKELFTLQFILFSKDILNWPKVTVKTFMMLWKVSASNKYFHTESWFPQKYWAAKVFTTLMIIQNISWAANQHIRTISEGSCDTED